MCLGKRCATAIVVLLLLFRYRTVGLCMTLWGFGREVCTIYGGIGVVPESNYVLVPEFNNPQSRLNLVSRSAIFKTFEFLG